MRKSETATRLAVATAVLVAVAPLCIGGLRADTQAALAAGALIVLCFTAWTALGHRPLAIPWPAWGPILLAGFGLVQLVPLPAYVLDVLSPVAHDLRARSLIDLGLFDGHPHPISLDPPSTWIALFHQAAFAALIVVGVRLGRRHGRIALRGVSIGGAGVAIIGLVHWLVDADQILGFYTPERVSHLDGYFSTFVNNNSLAGYLSLCTLVSLGWLAQTESPLSRRIAVACGGIAALGVFLSGSRGGQLALVLGVVTFVILTQVARRGEAGPSLDRARLVGRVAFALTALTMALAVSTQRDWSGLWANDGDWARLDTWNATFAYVGDFWATGSGRGTFRVVFPTYQLTPLSGTVGHPENIALQLAAEWGVIGAAIAIGCGVGGWLAIARRAANSRHGGEIGIAAGLAAAGVHQLVDLGFEGAGLSLPVAIVFGIGLAHLRRVERHERKPDRTRPTTTWGALAASLLVCGLLAWKGPTAVASAPDAAAAQITAFDGDAAALESHAASHAADHPSDYLVALATAIALEDRAAVPDRVMRWINRTLSLAPHNAEAQRLAAHVLLRAGRPNQAALQYRAAIEKAPWRSVWIIDEVVRRFTSTEHLLRAVPATREGRAQLVVRLNRRNESARARAVLEAILADDARDFGALATLGHTCIAQADPDCAHRAADALVAAGAMTDGHLLRARLAARNGERDRANEELEAANIAEITDRGRLGRVIRIYERLGNISGARSALDQLWPIVATENRAAADYFALRGRIEARLGEPDAARAAFEQARNLDDTPRYALLAARHAAETGQLEEARTILTATLSRYPGDLELVGALEALPEPRAID